MNIPKPSVIMPELDFTKPEREITEENFKEEIQELNGKYESWFISEENMHHIAEDVIQLLNKYRSAMYYKEFNLCMRFSRGYELSFEGEIVDVRNEIKIRLSKEDDRPNYLPDGVGIVFGSKTISWGSVRYV